MAKTQWAILFTTFLSSCISLVLLIVSIATPYWIAAKAQNNITVNESQINYGLFSGTLIRYVVASGYTYELTATCDYQKQACIYSCQINSDTRQEELRRILDGEEVENCPSPRTNYVLKSKFVENESNSGTLNNYSNRNTPPNVQYIDAGFWVSTIMFLSLAIIFASVAAIFSIINVIFNPVELIFSIFGLYIWNGISATSMFLTMILWGSLFEESLKYNIAITDTLQLELTSISKDVTLGYSYWIVLVAKIFSLFNIGLLILRKYLIEKELPPPIITVEKNDTTIMLY